MLESNRYNIFEGMHYVCFQYGCERDSSIQRRSAELEDSLCGHQPSAGATMSDRLSYRGIGVSASSVKRGRAGPVRGTCS